MNKQSSELESSGDVKNEEASSKLMKTDKSENAMLRSRIDEQGQLICFLKQRADKQLNRISVLEEINNELELLRTQAQEESVERLRMCKMLERRFDELAENHQEMIKIKDDYKLQCRLLSDENSDLKDQLEKGFSKKVLDRDAKIGQLTIELKKSAEKLQLNEKLNESLQNDLIKCKSETNLKISALQSELESYKVKCTDLSTKLKRLKTEREKQTHNDLGSIAALKKEKERLLEQVMERGKLVQDKQNAIDHLKKEVDSKEAEMTTLMEEFDRKKAAVDANLRVKTLQDQKDKAEKELGALKIKFEAFRAHSRTLLEQEKDLNSKLRNNLLVG